jgi:hypothetical protein
MQQATVCASIELLGMRNSHIGLQIGPGLHLGFSRIDMFDARTHQVLCTQTALCKLSSRVTSAELVERSHIVACVLKTWV